MASFFVGSKFVPMKGNADSPSPVGQMQFSVVLRVNHFRRRQSWGGGKSEGKCEPAQPSIP